MGIKKAVTRVGWGGPSMSVDHNKSLVSWFLLESFNGRDLEVADKVFASDHRLHSTAIETGVVEGPEAIKAMIKDYLDSLEAGAAVRCAILKQIGEGDWVSTYYTLEDINVTPEGSSNNAYRGVIISRFADGKIQESFVVAQEVYPDTDKKVFN
jgi:predicted SnoaL-like aldol condensation-catalyzing enzyme